MAIEAQTDPFEGDDTYWRETVLDAEQLGALSNVDATLRNTAPTPTSAGNTYSYNALSGRLDPATTYEDGLNGRVIPTLEEAAAKAARIILRETHLGPVYGPHNHIGPE
ncbi:MAG TPA: hypothetical protein VLF62_00860 [Candidatus Saccharimonadales bacterium]|nr:hypothetical protein [Candidatus Saccharimonadales bacterium]